MSDASIPISTRTRITTADGVDLEARWDAAAEPHTTTVFCHPHPLHGGTMNAPLMEKVTTHLVAAGFAVLRFNFRGVGESGGAWADGVGEVDDVAAAMEVARAAGHRMSISGWSFGAATALRWQAVAEDTTPYCGIAPPIRPMPAPDELRPARRTIIMGERDQLISFADSEQYASSIGADFVRVGADHFFFHREDRVADLVAAALCE